MLTFQCPLSHDLKDRCRPTAASNVTNRYPDNNRRRRCRSDRCGIGGSYAIALREYKRAESGSELLRQTVVHKWRFTSHDLVSSLSRPPKVAQGSRGQTTIMWAIAGNSAIECAGGAGPSHHGRARGVCRDVRPSIRFRGMGSAPSHKSGV